jgi:hypothetical protein
MNPMRVAWILTVATFLAGCGREWALPEFGGTGCITDADCLYGICSEGLCDEMRCREDEDCRYGICINNACDTSHCRDDDDCTVGLCIGDVCDADACHSDEDCAADFVCQGGTATQVGQCMAEVEGPPLNGDPHALRMADNLEEAAGYIAERHPDAFMIKVVGIGLRADGTVDVLKDYSSRWHYAFQDGDGVSQPPVFPTVTYLKQAGETVGLYMSDDGSVSEGLEVPEATWRAYRDATELVADFLQETGCVAPAQESSDSIVYSQTETGPQFILLNWKGQYSMGNPVTGEITAISCE